MSHFPAYLCPTSILTMALLGLLSCASPAPAQSLPATAPAAPRPPRPAPALISRPVERAAKALAPSAAAISASIDLSAAGTPASSGIFGGTSSPEVALEVGSPIIRYGGNRASATNWKTGYDSSGNDWYYVNNPYTNQVIPPEERLNAFGNFKKQGLDLYLTIPMMGRVAKDGTSVAFDIRKYKDQVTWEGKDHPGDVHPYAGNGLVYVRDDKGEIMKGPDGKALTKRLVPDPNDTSIEMSAEEQCDMLRFMVEKMGYGTADKGGLKYMCLDNEPGLWHETHYAMRPNHGVSYDEYWQRTVDYAGRLKKIDPALQIAGPATWGWTEFFYSGLDQQLMKEGKGKPGETADFVNHGKVPFVKWWITKLAEYQKANGVRLVDILDYHFYPAWPRSRAGDPVAQEATVQYTRVWWDPAFKDTSWMGSETNHVLRIVPMIKEWIAECNPGMKTCIGEYGVGGGNDASGGVAMAEMLGVWSREGTDLAFMWGGPGANSPTYFAFKMFRNPDGKHTVFGDRYLPANCEAPLDVSVHAAKDSKTGRITFILINKRGAKDAKVTLKLSAALPEQDVDMYEYGTADKAAIGKLPARKVQGDRLEIDLPAMSVLRFDVKP